MHPLVHDIIINKDSIISLTMDEAQMDEDCAQQLILVIHSLLQPIE
jgi:hypothetical protein